MHNSKHIKSLLDQAILDTDSKGLILKYKEYTFGPLHKEDGSKIVDHILVDIEHISEDSLTKSAISICDTKARTINTGIQYYFVNETLPKS